ncbi:thiol reductant ABC exporter subunit CydD [Thalassospira profundimaris]|nr:thiol reductant ABC exporter subunit CydD [Thalassospira profundimaris]
MATILAPGLRARKKSAVLSVLAALIWPLQAAVVARAFGQLLAGETASALWAALIFATLGIVRAGLSYLAEAQAQHAADHITAKIRADIIAREAIRSDESAFGGAGGISALASEKLDLLIPFVTRYAPAQARVMVVPVVILALAFWYSWAAGAVLLISGPLIPVFMALVGMAAKEASARQMTEIGTLNDFLVERLSALADIRLLGAGPAVLQGFASQAADLRRRTMAVLAVAFLSSTVLELFAAIGVAMVAVYVGFSLLGVLEFGAWGGQLMPTAGIFLLLLAPEFYQPLRDLSAAWHDKAAATAVIDEIYAYRADTGHRLQGTGGQAAPLPGPASVVLSGCHTLSGRPLPEISIAPGEHVALVGPSGAGKTSALRLMAGLEVPVTGHVMVADHPLNEANADRWRARLGWMPQAPHFLTGSVQRNLTLGRHGDIAKAIDTAALQKVLDTLPQGLATQLGETGGGLSGGEARRLMLARAIFGTPDLILADEPTADLDGDTARAVTHGLLEYAARGVTLVIATHDRDLAAQMDRIIDLGAV